MTTCEATAINELIPRLRAYARFITRDADRADDLVQTSLELALRRFHQFQPGTNLRAWLFTILRHAHINELRRDARRPIAMDPTLYENQLSVPAPQDSQLALQDLTSCMAQLSKADRDVLRLVGAEGMSYEDTAALLHVPIGTVRSRLSRARDRLRARLDRPVAAPRDGDNRPVGFAA